MARGFVAGGMSFGLFSIVAIVLTGALPMWLISRTELIDKFCWYGEGIWATSYRFGSDMPQFNLKCDSDASKSASTEDAYCNDVETLYPSSESFRDEMCTTTTWAKRLLIISGVASIAGVSFGFGSHIFSRFRLQIICSCFATTFMFLSLVCQSSVLILMQTSPLFSDEHYHDLSRGMLNKYDSMLCSYQFPHIWTFTFDGPMQCLFPGPSFAFSLTGIICSLFSFMLFALKWREALLIRRNILHRGNSLDEHFWERSHSPLFGDNVGATPPSGGFGGSSGSLGGVGGWSGDLGFMFSPGMLIPSTFKFERHYSLYGAFLRRFSHRSVLMRHIINFIPPLLNIVHAVLLGWWVMTGTTLGVSITVEEVRHHRSHDNMIIFGDNSTKYIEELILDSNYTTLEVSELSAFLPWRGKTFRTVDQVIEFSPLTTTNIFIKAGTPWFGVIQLTSTMIWPIAKILLWAWLWYTPADEVFRGRVLSWVDALGKVVLANLYTFTFITLANHFTRDIFIPWYFLPLFILPFHTLKISMEFSLRVGFGTYGFVIAFVLSMVMGELQLMFHRFAKTWEEKRRARQERSWNLTGRRDSDIVNTMGSDSSATITPLLNSQLQQQQQTQILQQQQQQGSSSTTDSSSSSHRSPNDLFNVNDTPYMMMMTSRQMEFEKQKRKSATREAREEGIHDTQFDLDEESARHDAGAEGGAAAAPNQSFDSLNDRSPPPVPEELRQAQLRQRKLYRSRQDSDISSYGDDEMNEVHRHIPFADDAFDGLADFYRHHKKEALHNHIFSPRAGQFHRFTKCGKVFVACMMVFIMITIIMAQTTISYGYERGGLVGEVVMPEEQKLRKFSVYSSISAIGDCGLFGEPPTAMLMVIVVFVIVFPLVHFISLCLIWWVPMSPKTQYRVILIMEVISAWSSIDIFTVSMFATYLDVGPFVSQLVDAAGLSWLDAILAKTPLESFIVQKPKLYHGFGWLVTACVLEKLLEHFVQVKFATMIAERSAVRKFERQVARLPSKILQRAEGGLGTTTATAAGGNLSSIQEELDEEASTGDIQQQQQQQQFDTSGATATMDVEREQREALLSNQVIREHFDVLSPTARYAFAGTKSDRFYAGLPWFFWDAYLYLGITEVDHSYEEIGHEIHGGNVPDTEPSGFVLT